MFFCIATRSFSSVPINFVSLFSVSTIAFPCSYVFFKYSPVAFAPFLIPSTTFGNTSFAYLTVFFVKSTMGFAFHNVLTPSFAIFAASLNSPLNTFPIACPRRPMPSMVFLTESIMYVFIVPPKSSTLSFTLLKISDKLPKLETQSITTPTPSTIKLIKSENIIDIVFATVFTASITLWFPIKTSLNLKNTPTKAPMPVIRIALPNMFQPFDPFLASFPDFSAPPPAPFTLFPASSALLPKS